MPSFRTDAGGFAFKSSDIKIGIGGWGTKMSQIHRQKGYVRIMTYSLPNKDYIDSIFDKRSDRISIICNSKFRVKAKRLKQKYPAVALAINPEIHSKVLLIEPVTLWVSSANFGRSSWHETTVGIHSKRAHDWCCERFVELWGKSDEV